MRFYPITRFLLTGLSFWAPCGLAAYSCQAQVSPESQHQNASANMASGHKVSDAAPLDQMEIEGYRDLGIDFSLQEEKSGFTVRFGVDYSQGDYGDPEQTTTTYLPLSFAYDQNAWRFQASIGHISLSGKDIIIPGTGLTSFSQETDTERQARDEKGFGDLYLSATYAIEALRQKNIFLDITTRIKLPTGSAEKGLSTGKADFSLQVDATHLIGDFAPFVTLGYRHVGKTERLQLQDSWFTSVGMVYYPSYKLSIGLFYDVRKAATLDTANPQEIQAFLDWQLSRDWAVNVYGIGGLSEGSPDFSSGLQLRYSY